LSHPPTHPLTGEGIAKVDDRIIQTTWRERTGFVYNANNLQLIKTFHYSTQKNEGWGITYNPKAKELIVSDGSPYLFFWDPDTFKETRRVRVEDGLGNPVNMLNELEYVNGYVWANVW